MYGLIRILLGGIPCIISWIFINKRKKENKKLKILCLVLCLALTFVMYFVPFENLFVTFESANSAYSYCNWGNKELSFILTGTDCDFLVSDNGKALEYLILPKTEQGWKIGRAVQTKEIFEKLEEDAFISVFKHKSSEDCFVAVTNLKDIPLNIFDNLDTEFFPYQSKSWGTVIYYGYLKGIPSGYSLNINGKVVEVTD
jgi:hypothetical protein